ncbi:hypothetical protein PPL_01689 [Heterostelium album PN500]|uniref:Uncharacterized protein n=1 Tax=Heterostelium pallidum (strain ATCC 26659 / Pp 5 / PN500) TaxID=670386 RepID=D3B073_HETP5|nr:hypothetical protein PPL_01689 [Heterostelium album PN500]EFA84697.1 hypothetical protein PPL_01689 [Heterostelium album PN500]|eukprot:XP_020436810.1 hypothetical protein PPL_01689 [Heterostelium album PN500]
MMSQSTQSQSTHQTPQMNSSSNSVIGASPTNPSVMTYNPTYNKCLPKILSDLDCEMRVKQVLKCIEMMLTDGAEDISNTPSSHPLSGSTSGINNPAQGQAFTSFKLSSPTVTGQSPSPSPMLDRQVPTPNKKVRRSESLDDESNVHLTPNITSLSLQQQSPLRNGVAVGNASPKNKIKINIARMDDQVRLNNNGSPVQQATTQPSMKMGVPQPSPTNNSSTPDDNSKFKQSTDKLQLDSKDGKQSNVQIQHEINSLQYQAAAAAAQQQQQQQAQQQQQQYIINHGIPMNMGMIQQNTQPTQPQIITEDGRRVLTYPYDVNNHQNIVNVVHLQQHQQQQQIQQQNLEQQRRHSFNPYDMSKMTQDGRNPFSVDQAAVLEQQRRLSYTFDPNQPQPMMQQVHLMHQQQIKQQQQQQQQSKSDTTPQLKPEPHSSPIIQQQPFVDQANQRNEFSSSPSVAPLSDLSNETKHFKSLESDSQQVPSKPKESLDQLESNKTDQLIVKDQLTNNQSSNNNQQQQQQHQTNLQHLQSNQQQQQQQQYLTPLLTGTYPAPPIGGTEEYNWIFSFLDIDNQNGNENQPIPQ